MITVIAIYKNGYAVDTYQTDGPARHRVDELLTSKKDRVFGVFVYNSTGGTNIRAWWRQTHLTLKG